MSSRSSDLRRARPLLGTIVEVVVGGAPRAVLHRGVDAAFRAVSRVHDLMSFHDPESELSRLNREARHRAVRVAPETFAVLALARQVAEASEGLFDTTIAPQLVQWGYLPAFNDAVPERQGTIADVEFRPGRRVRYARPLLIDLSGIAKGYAVDLAVEALRMAGVARGVVNAGGDLRVFGPGAETVHVRHPRRPGLLVPLASLREAAVATSADYFSRRLVGGRWVSPIVHPGHGAPRVRAGSVSVVAPICAVADALTKVVILGGTAAFPILKRFSASALVLTTDGHIVVSEGVHAS